MPASRSALYQTPTELTFVDGTVMDRKMVAPQFRQDANEFTVCGLRADTDVRPDEVSCIRVGRDNGPSIISKSDFMPGVQFDDISVDCGIESTTKEIVCRDSVAREGSILPPEGQFKAVASGAGFLCGIRLDGTIACARPIVHYGPADW